MKELEFRKLFPNIVMHYDNIIDKDKYYFITEAFPVVSHHYNCDFLKNFKGVITWSSVVFNEFKDKLNIIKVLGFPMFNRDFYLENFVDYKDKINGVCLLSRHRENVGEGCIVEKRLEVMENINNNSILASHCYGKNVYGGVMYRGQVGQCDFETMPSSLAKLECLNRYKFNLAFENVYHKIWSWDYKTEKLADAFRAKTLAIYYGAYNIEKIVPKELFVDYRDFENDNDLVRYLLSIDEKKYKEITENAHEWDMKDKYGNIEELIKVLDNWMK